MYDHYIAFDWALSKVAVARMSGKSGKLCSFETSSDIKELQIYLTSLKGKKILTIEESTPSQWLYTEFYEYVDELIICDPRRNALLSEGAKTDLIDAKKLVRLLRSGLLKSVYHSFSDFILLRKLFSGYEDLIQSGVRMKNQRSALLRAKNIKKDESIEQKDACEEFVLGSLDTRIALYEKEKREYQKEIHRVCQKSPMNRLTKVPGIGDINAIKIVSRVVDGNRFPSRNHFLSYCGLVKHDKQSGGRSYGKRSSNYSRSMKCVFKHAALVATHCASTNHFSSYFEHLIKQKNVADFKARHAVSRRIATIVWAMLKNDQAYDPEKLKCKNNTF
jgi:transposase